MSKYNYIFDPNWMEAKKGIPIEEKIITTLGYSVAESGELESLRRELDNTQRLLSNLILFLMEKGDIKESDWDILTGNK